MKIDFSTFNFKCLHKTSKKNAGITIPTAYSEPIFVDRIPPCFNKSKNPEIDTKKLTSLCEELSPIASTMRDIHFCKYGNGSYYGFSDFDDETTADEFKMYQSIKEEKYFAEHLEKLLKKYKFINSKTKVLVERLNPNHVSHAGFGYKITLKNGNKEDYLFAKIFHQNIEEKGRQGIYSSIPIRIYFNHNKVAHPDFPHFYFGKTDAGFLFAEYIEPNRKVKGFIYPDKLLGIAFTDERNFNRVSQYRVDAGGIYPINNLATNVVARGIAKKLFRTPDKEKVKKWNELFENNFANKDDVVAGLVYVIEFLPKSSRKKCYLKIINSEFIDKKEVKLAELLSIELREMLFDKNANIKYFKSEVKKLDKKNLLSENEKEYLRYKLSRYNAK